MLLNQDYRFRPQPRDLISICKQNDGTVWFSCVDYGNREDGSRVNGSEFCIVFEPRHLPELRELIAALEKMQDEKPPAHKYEEVEAQWPKPVAPTAETTS